MVLDAGERLSLEIGIAEDTAVWSDQRDAGAQELRQAIRLVIQRLVRCKRGILGEQFGNELRLADEARFDAGALFAAALQRDDEGEKRQRRSGHAERCEKALGPEAEAHVLTSS